MSRQLTVYNSLTRQKEAFTPITPGFVGLYVCGPTVYSDVHLGNCRTFVSFDVIYRYLLHLGNRVRYVRNVTDVGHLTDEGEDKLAAGARKERLEPMEVAQKYTNGFHDMMRLFNTLSPTIEPRATGHIIEQIAMVQTILDRGLAYEVNGSVYFDVAAYNARNEDSYGELSGRRIDELMAESRDDLVAQGDKRHPSDFAIWMAARPEHLMRWHSPWGEGFPGWHLECSAMSVKYLGEEFDIHGGGNDLKFPHHENEIAQNKGACAHGGARYWLHTNMLLMNGKKMSKSDGNTITPEQLFSGESEHVSRGYSPMVLRFFMLQSHYRSTLDIGDEALQAAQKGYDRLFAGYRTLLGLETPAGATAGPVDATLLESIEAAYAEMDDDFNTPKALARLFELVSKINGIKGGQIDPATVAPATLELLKETFRIFIYDILGLTDEQSTAGTTEDPRAKALDGVMDMVLTMRRQAREEKDWGRSDQIRDALKVAGIQVKDGKEGVSWAVE